MVKKIGDFGGHKPCLNPEHKPPMHIVLENGVYEHICPGCGHKTIFTVNRPMYCKPYSWKSDGPGPETFYALG